MIKIAPLIKNKIIVINNPLDLKFINSKMNINMNIFKNKSKIQLLSVGRLEHQKGYDLLISMFVKLPENYNLTILGEEVCHGNKDKLIAYSKKLGVSERIIFKGFVNNPYEYMANADIFVLSSRYEGFPNVVLEALGCGIPVVAFECPGGINEIIIDGINGFKAIEQDVDDLKDKIIKASNAIFDKNMVIKSVVDRYSISKIIKKYNKLFSSI